MKALIIGAGIAGPAAAMFLRRVGIEVDVFEARGANEEEGAFLNLMPNGMRVLDRLGIASDVADHGFPSTGMEFLNARGRSLALLDVGGVERSGVTPIVIRRAALNGALRDAALVVADREHADRERDERVRAPEPGHAGEPVESHEHMEAVVREREERGGVGEAQHAPREHHEGREHEQEQPEV